jgi:type IX secretion system PorP/SprF family membrane protein
MTRIYVLLGILCTSAPACSQQIPLNNLYTDNQYLINAAYRGSGTHVESSLNYRTQWVNFQGSPNTVFLTGLYDAGRSLTLGGKLSRDESNVLNTTAFLGTVSYELKLDLANTISFGVGVGFFYNALDFARIKATNSNDPLLNSRAGSKWNFANEVSVYWQFRDLQTAVSIPGLISDYKKKHDILKNDFVDQRPTIVVFVAYKLAYHSSLEFKPSLLIRYVPGYTGQVDINVDAKYAQTFSVGIGYRQNAGILGRIGMDINRGLHMGYGYEFFPAGIASYSGGSHEIQLTIRFAKQGQERQKSETRKAFREFFKFDRGRN